jgi:hypothetical protein
MLRRTKSQSENWINSLILRCFFLAVMLSLLNKRHLLCVLLVG